MSTWGDPRAIRARYRLSQRQLALLLGVSPAAVAKWETGDLPVPGTAWRLLLVLEAVPDGKRNGAWRELLESGRPVSAWREIALGVPA